MPFDKLWESTLLTITGKSRKYITKKCASYYKKIEKEFSDPLAVDAKLAEIREDYPIMLRSFYELDKIPENEVSQYAFKCDGQFRVTTIIGKPSWLSQHVELNSTNCDYNLIPRRASFFPDRHTNHLLQLVAFLDFRGIDLWDNNTYCLRDSLIQNQRVSARFTNEKFLKHRFTVGIIADELEFALLGAGVESGSAPSIPDRKVPFRKHFRKDISSLLTSTVNLPAGGIDVVIAIARPEPFCDFAIPIQERSEIVSDNHNRIAVIPKAFHQSMTDPVAEIDLQNTIWREFFEELLGGEEAERDIRRVDTQWYKKECPAIKWLHSEPDRFRIFITSHGVNMLTGNYTYGMLLVIVDEQFWCEFGYSLIPSWEAKNIKIRSSTNHNELTLLLKDSNWSDDSLVSFSEGLKVLSSIYEDRVSKSLNFERASYSR